MGDGNLSIISDLIEVGKVLYHKNLVVGKLGNLSARIEGGFVITSSGSSLGNLKEGDFVFLNEEGGAVEKGKKPSMETPLHLEIYKNRNDVNAIVHTHSPYSVIIGLKNSHLDFSLVFIEEKFKVGVVPLLPSGSDELSKETARILLKRNVAILKKHGVVAVGKSPFEALYLVETIEHLSKLMYLLQTWKK